MEPTEAQDYINTNASQGDYITLSTQSKEVSGEIKTVSPLIIEPISGVILKYEMTGNGELIEVYWDDSEGANDTATKERTVGLVKSVNIED